MILCLGDSLTLGHLGYSYLDFLKPRVKIVNKGVNGDTTWGALKRLRKYLNNPRYQDISTIIIAIGTNDLLLPYLSSLSLVWKVQNGPKAARKKCCTQDDQFREIYEQLIELAQPRKLVLVGLPLIHLDRFPSETLLRRNRIIRELAAKYGLPFVDIYALQKAALTKEPNSYTWGVTNLRLVRDSLLMLIFPSSKDWLARRRGLELTVDGVHFNSVSAKLLAEEIKTLKVVT